MNDNTETAILAAGCFWGVQQLLRHRDGVISTTVGYTGGDNDNPTYGNHPGHAEAVEIVFDPERYNLANLFYEAVGDEPAGKVIVLASNGYTDTSMGGGTKLLRLHQNGCAGVLTDGRLRDFDELGGYDFAAYCAGEATRWGGDHVTPFQANVPVVLDRVAVMPGHYVFADSSGAVVIPDVQIEEVLAEARKVEAADAAVRDQIGREQVRDKPKPVRSRERRSS